MDVLAPFLWLKTIENRWYV